MRLWQKAIDEVAIVMNGEWFTRSNALKLNTSKGFEALSDKSIKALKTGWGKKMEYPDVISGDSSRTILYLKHSIMSNYHCRTYLKVRIKYWTYHASFGGLSFV